MTTKITITLKADDELPAEAADHQMTAVLQMLSTHGVIPLRQLVLTLETAEEDDANEVRDDLRVLLTARPIGVEAKIEKKTKEDVERSRMATVTPMDKIQGFADKYGVDSVTLSTDKRSVTLTRETAATASEMLRRSAGE